MRLTDKGRLGEEPLACFYCLVSDSSSNFTSKRVDFLLMESFGIAVFVESFSVFEGSFFSCLRLFSLFFIGRRNENMLSKSRLNTTPMPCVVSALFR